MTGHRFELKPVAKEEDNVFSLLLPVHNLLLQTSVFEATELEARAFAAKANATTRPNAQDGFWFRFLPSRCVCVCGEDALLALEYAVRQEHKINLTRRSCFVGYPNF